MFTGAANEVAFGPVLSALPRFNGCAFCRRAAQNRVRRMRFDERRGVCGARRDLLARKLDQVQLIRRWKSNAANRIRNGYFFEAGDQRLGLGDAILYGRQC